MEHINLIRFRGFATSDNCATAAGGATNGGMVPDLAADLAGLGGFRRLRSYAIIAGMLIAASAHRDVCSWWRGPVLLPIPMANTSNA